MMPKTNRLLMIVLAGVLAFAAALPRSASAQDTLFAPVVRVNDRVVTFYELQQRIRFYQLLRAPGDLDTETIETLIDERLQQYAAAALGITVTDGQLQAGIEEFAARTQLTPDAFRQTLAQEGIDAETFSEFVRTGLLWREVVGTRFGPRARITEDEIDRAIALIGTQGGVRVLLSEIALLADTPERAERARAVAQELSEIDSFDAFARAARTVSAAPSRAQDGQLDWLPLAGLPPQIAAQVLTLKPGEVSTPVPIGNAIALFQLRALEETGTPMPRDVSVEFARYLIPGGHSAGAQATARRIRGQVDSCDDLYGIARGQPEARLLRDTLPVAELPDGLAAELARLDEGEVSTALTAEDGQQLVFLMLCARTRTLPEGVSREQIREGLFTQRLESHAENYLAQLREDAVIVQQ